MFAFLAQSPLLVKVEPALAYCHHHSLVKPYSELVSYLFSSAREVAAFLPLPIFLLGVLLKAGQVSAALQCLLAKEVPDLGKSWDV